MCLESLGWNVFFGLNQSFGVLWKDSSLSCLEEGEGSRRWTPATPETRASAAQSLTLLMLLIPSLFLQKHLGTCQIYWRWFALINSTDPLILWILDLWDCSQATAKGNESVSRKECSFSVVRSSGLERKTSVIECSRIPAPCFSLTDEIPPSSFVCLHLHSFERPSLTAQW